MKVKYALVYGLVTFLLVIDFLFIKRAVEVALILKDINLEPLGFAVLFWSIMILLIQPVTAALLVWTIKE
jgi:hypothetical protein